MVTELKMGMSSRACWKIQWNHSFKTKYQAFFFIYFFKEGWSLIGSSFLLFLCATETNSFNTKSTEEDCWGEWDGGLRFEGIMGIRGEGSGRNGIPDVDGGGIGVMEGVFIMCEGPSAPPDVLLVARVPSSWPWLLS